MPTKVTDPALLAELNGSAASSAAPGVIYGRPKAVDPYKEAAERRAIEDQMRQQGTYEASRRKEQRDIAEFEGTGGAGTVDEKKIATLVTRVFGGLSDIKGVLATDPEAARPGFIEGVRGDLSPGGLSGMLARKVAGPSRRAVNDSERDMLDALLTLGTGAAYSPEQLRAEVSAHFPQYGDTKEEAAIKMQRLERVIEAAKANAGPAWARVEPEIAPFLKGLSASSAGESNPDEDEGLVGTVTFTPDPNNPDDAKYFPARREVVNARVNDTNALESGIIGAADSLTFGTLDELSAGLNSFTGALSGEGAIGNLYKRNLAEERGVMAALRKRDPKATIAGQVVGGLAVPFGAGARTVRALAATGAVQGGLYGAGSGDGLGRVTGAATGAALGGTFGAGLGAAGGKVAQLLGRRGIDPERLAASNAREAAGRQGIEMLPADAGGPMTRRATSGLAQTMFGAGPVIRAGQRVTNQAAAARDRVAGAVGRAGDPVDAGEAATRGAQSYISNSSAQGGRLYDEAERLAGDAQIEARGALAQVQQSIQELSAAPETNAAAINALRSLESDLSRPLTVAAARNIRTNARGLVSDGLRGTDTERRIGQIVDSLSGDIAGSLEAQGNTAARQAFEGADTYWRQRLATIDDTLAPIIGRNGDKSGEQVFQALQTASRSNGQRLRSFLGTLPDDEAATVRATVVSQLGRSNDGAQNAAGDAFSLNTFLTHWNRMTPRAKASLFDRETRTALNDIAQVAERSREATRYNNLSNSGGAINAAGFFSGTAAIGSLGASAIVENVTARMLTSPAFAQWLARAPQARDPQALARRLSVVATREPAIAQDVLGLQRALEQAFQGTQAAAAPTDRNR